MAAWNVTLTAFPPGRRQDFYRIWLKHDHGRTDEEILAALARFDPASPPVIARYPVEEAAENVVAEVTNLGGEARLEQAEEAA